MFEFLYYVYNWWYYIPLDTVADDFVGVWRDDACDTQSMSLIIYP